MNSTIIITAADSKFFDLVQGTILSIRDKPQGRSVDIGFFDLGCTPEQLEWILGQVNHVVEPDWNYTFPGIENAPSYLRGLLARPSLPKYFPGYEIYIWIDADAWVQDWFAIDLLIRGSKRHNISIIPEIDRGYISRYSQMDIIWKWVHDQYKLCFTEEIANTYYSYPVLNAGVFGMRYKSPIWQLWSQNLNNALQRSINLWTDQTALNLTIYRQEDWEDQVEFLPAYCNWGFASPAWDPLSQKFVEPYLPHHPIGILHLTAGNKYREKFVLKTTQNNYVEIGLRYRKELQSYRVP